MNVFQTSFKSLGLSSLLTPSCLHIPPLGPRSLGGGGGPRDEIRVRLLHEVRAGPRPSDLAINEALPRPDRARISFQSMASIIAVRFGRSTGPRRPTLLREMTSATSGLPDADELSDTTGRFNFSYVSIIERVAAIVGMPTMLPAIPGSATIFFIKKHLRLSCFLFFSGL